MPCRWKKKPRCLLPVKPKVFIRVQKHRLRMPSGNIFYKDGAALNSADGIRVTLTGQQVHGSMPWEGRDSIVAAADIIQNLQTMVSRRADLSKGMGVVSIGQIQGGTSGNILPEQVSMIGTIRSNHEDIRQSIFKNLDRKSTRLNSSHVRIS